MYLHIPICYMHIGMGMFLITVKSVFTEQSEERTLSSGDFSPNCIFLLLCNLHCRDMCLVGTFFQISRCHQKIYFTVHVLIFHILFVSSLCTYHCIHNKGWRHTSIVTKFSAPLPACYPRRFRLAGTWLVLLLVTVLPWTQASQSFLYRWCH